MKKVTQTQTSFSLEAHSAAVTNANVGAALDWQVSDPVAAPQRGRRSVSRNQIVHAAMDCIKRHDCESLSVAELASAAGVSERTLRTAFQEQFGLGPARYLKCRTFNMVRKALQEKRSCMTTVTKVATQFSIWQSGRFAHDYYALFGELPSVTLRSKKTVPPRR